MSAKTKRYTQSTTQVEFQCDSWEQVIEAMNEYREAQDISLECRSALDPEQEDGERIYWNFKAQVVEHGER